MNLNILIKYVNMMDDSIVRQWLTQFSKQIVNLIYLVLVLSSIVSKKHYPTFKRVGGGEKRKIIMLRISFLQKRMIKFLDNYKRNPAGGFDTINTSGFATTKL